MPSLHIYLPKIFAEKLNQATNKSNEIQKALNLLWGKTWRDKNVRTEKTKNN